MAETYDIGLQEDQTTKEAISLLQSLEKKHRADLSGILKQRGIDWGKDFPIFKVEEKRVDGKVLVELSCDISLKDAIREVCGIEKGGPIATLRDKPTKVIYHHPNSTMRPG